LSLGLEAVTRDLRLPCGNQLAYIGAAIPHELFTPSTTACCFIAKKKSTTASYIHKTMKRFAVAKKLKLVHVSFATSVYNKQEVCRSPFEATKKLLHVCIIIYVCPKLYTFHLPHLGDD
ncbi:hypothetical protein Dimus_030519, partial [Dionaea muscipula]